MIITRVFHLEGVNRAGRVAKRIETQRYRSLGFDTAAPTQPALAN